MNATKRQYLFGLIFIGVGIYYLTVQNFLEFSLFGVAGLSFIVNAMTLDAKFAAYKKTLVPVSWVLILPTALLFLYLVQFRWF